MRVALVIAVGLFLSACDGCQQPPAGIGKGMCVKCERSRECAQGMSCVAGVCETAPPSCHVQIGL